MAHENTWNRPAPTQLSSGPRAALRWLDNVCWIAAGLCLAVFLISWLGKVNFQASQERRFETIRQMSAGTALPALPLRPGELFGRVAIPRIGLSAMVAEGDDKSTLPRAVGHIPGTAAPESVGNVGLAGHRDTFFRGLGRVRLKDLIELETAHGTYEYEVVHTAVVDPEQTEVLDSSNKSELTLVTCYPFHYIGAAPRRFIVQASLVSPR